SDAIAPQMVGGLLQKAAMTSMPLVMAEKGSEYTGKYIGGFTPEQRKKIDANMARLKQLEEAPAAHGTAAGSNAKSSGAVGPGAGGMIALQTRSVVGESKNKPMISFYAAAIGVMFLLFTAS